MKDDIRDIKEIIDLTLNDIYVTDSLKNKTLKACMAEKKRNLKTYITAVASVAFIALSIVGYQQFNDRSINPPQKLSQAFTNKSTSENTKDQSNTINNSKNNIDQNNTIDTNKKATYNKDKNKSIPNNSNNVSASLPNTSKDNNTTINNKVENQQSNIENVSPSANANIDASVGVNTDMSDKSKQNTLVQDKVADINDIPLPSITEDSSTLAKNSADASNNTTFSSSASHIASPSTAEAENYWGGKLSLPSYIPKDFELTDIFIPKNDSREKYVKLTYSFKNNYFKLLQNKSTTYSSNGKSIDINGAKAYITQNKDDSNPNSSITQICWNKDNIQYCITGNLPEDDLINICASIK